LFYSLFTNKTHTHHTIYNNSTLYQVLANENMVTNLTCKLKYLNSIHVNLCELSSHAYIKLSLHSVTCEFWVNIFEQVKSVLQMCSINLYCFPTLNEDKVLIVKINY